LEGAAQSEQFIDFVHSESGTISSESCYCCFAGHRLSAAKLILLRKYPPDLNFIAQSFARIHIPQLLLV
jgi:hypothetical protein